MSQAPHVAQHARARLPEEPLDPLGALLRATLRALGIRTRRRLSWADLSPLSWPGPTPGQSALAFDVTTLDGEQRRLEDYLGTPLVIETGSITCQHFRAGAKAMGALAKRHPNVTFLVLYVTEAHPCHEAPRHTSVEQKRRLAERLVAELDEARAVLLADVEGVTHAAYGGYQNMVYILDAEGTVVYRSNQREANRVADVLGSSAFPLRMSEDFVLRPSETGLLRTFDWSQRSFLMARERARFEVSRLRRRMNG